jgi:ribosomal protection tetracycline resistance protein
MRMLNLGIVAHVDAGKTSLTERLLFDSGAIARLGSVDDGSTRTDGMDLERRRGITIRSAVATFVTGDCEVHLIDTPGHTDFVAEVERALGVLDGAILVLSAVEGVQPHTRVLMRVLRSMGVPTLVFVNKIDRVGARDASLLTDIRRLLTPAAIPVTWPRAGGVVDLELGVAAAEVLAERSDAVLESYVSGLDPALVRREFVRQARAGSVFPVFFGSAISGVGVDALRRGIVELLPAGEPVADGPVDGVVFAVERDRGRRYAVARLFSGSLAARDTVDYGRAAGRATAVLDGDGRPARVPAGGIARIAGLPGLRVGDRLGSGSHPVPTGFRPPTFETVVTSDQPTALFDGLAQLADQDPLINIRRGQEPGSLVVSLYGEVQREVIAARLAEEFGVRASFAPARVVCVERVVGVGHGVLRIGDTEPVLFATVGLRIEPGPVGSGVAYELEAERGSLPAAFLTAIEETVRAELRGSREWAVVDCVVTLTHTGFSSPVSTAADFRQVTPMVLATALERAGTVVCEPWDRVELDVPEDAISAVLGAVVRVGGLPEPPVVDGEVGWAVIESEVPAERVRDVERALPGMTGGLGVLIARFDSYRPVGR